MKYRGGQSFLAPEKGTVFLSYFCRNCQKPARRASETCSPCRSCPVSQPYHNSVSAGPRRKTPAAISASRENSVAELPCVRQKVIIAGGIGSEMNFASDNWAGAHPKIAQSLVAAATEYDSAYGGSRLDLEAADRFGEIFGREVAVFFLGTGTVANALAFAAANRPGGVVFCHAESHPIVDEGGATEYLTGGARIQGVRGAGGKYSAETLAQTIARFPREFIHHGQPMAVSLAQATELGTAYSLPEIEAIAGVAGQANLPLHMDGARFANALCALELEPAQMTWKAGIDMMSFGATKNGCWCAEALVFFDPSAAVDFPFIRKRAGQIYSKSRFIAAQFLAYFEDGLWLELARHANGMAQTLSAAIDASVRMNLAWKPQSNEVFAVMDKDMLAQLKARGVKCSEWAKPAECPVPVAENQEIVRFVTNFATTEAEIDRFAELI
jgi:threonine aldolase